jgi:hypothetical protein
MAITNSPASRNSPASCITTKTTKRWKFRKRERGVILEIGWAKPPDPWVIPLARDRVAGDNFVCRPDIPGMSIIGGFGDGG